MKKSRNIKPTIGIHFHEDCCLKNGQIVKYVNPQYSGRKNGWNHKCSAFDGDNVYLNDQYMSNQCNKDGKLTSSDHLHTNKCGIFINFEVS